MGRIGYLGHARREQLDGSTRGSAQDDVAEGRGGGGGGRRLLVGEAAELRVSHHRQTELVVPRQTVRSQSEW